MRVCHHGFDINSILVNFQFEVTLATEVVAVLGRLLVEHSGIGRSTYSLRQIRRPSTPLLRHCN